MPKEYRAPEVILGLARGHAIDIWSVGMMVRAKVLVHMFTK